MAAKESKLLAEIDDNFLSCTICSERYKNAKLLPCLHSFCEPCLGKLAEKSGPIVCPICRRSHQLPDSGVAGIGANSFINELIELFRKRDEASAKSSKCEGCQEAESIKHCVECGFDLCRVCANSHGRFPTTRSHQLMTLEEFESAKSGDLASVQPPIYCASHPDYQVEFYCDTCDVAICLKCAALDHPITEHKYRHLKDAATEYCKDLTEVIDKVKEKEDEASHSKAVVTETAESLDICYQTEDKKMKEHIQETIDDVTRMIRENGDKLLGELKDEYDRRKVNLIAQLKELEFAESDVSYAREYAENLMLYGNAAQLMSAKKGIATQMEELLRMETKIYPTETDYMEFKPCDDFCGTKTVGVISKSPVTADNCSLVDVPEFARVGEDITITLATDIKQRIVSYGKVKVEAVLKKPDDSQEDIGTTNNGDGTWSLKTRANMTGNHEVLVSVSKKPVKGSPVTIGVIPQKGLICQFGQKGCGVGQLSEPWGVMVTGDGNVRVCDGGNRLQTFTRHGQHRCTTTFSNISTKVDPMFSAVSEDGSIFTTDFIGEQVIVHDENGRVMRCFGKGVIESPFGIAIHPANGMVYVVDRDGNCVHIYNKNGDHYKSFGELYYPIGVSIDAAGKVFVADNHRIQVFDAEGEYLYSFGSEGSGDNQMSYPRGISHDSDGNVYVCDHGNHRVMKYESDGRFICRIDSDDNHVAYPSGICVTDDRPFGNVIVASTLVGNGCVKVFAQ